jgi:HK97 gp10 family phage protein
MAATTVKIEGLAELDNALSELPKATARNVLKRILKKRAEPIKEAWQAKAPKLTGHLEESIIVGPSSRLTSRQKREARGDEKFFSELHIGTADPAGLMTEFGNSHQAAEPSGRPAWESTKAAALEGIGADLGDEIEKARARLARKAERLAAKG